LEGEDWGEPTYNSSLVTTCHRLRRKPLKDFTVEDLRIMIGQNIGLHFLLPLAIERLEENPLAAGDHYPGDLLASILRIEARFWRERPDLKRVAESIVSRAMPLPEELGDALEAFQQSGGVI